jgi:hypothetical protein
MTTIDNEKSQKSQYKYFCKYCDYSSPRKDHYERHLSTPKHLKTTTLTTSNNEPDTKVTKKYSCDNCEKKFNDRAGLWRHNKKCCQNTTQNDITKNQDFVFDKEFVMMILKQNKEVMKQNSELTHMMKEQHTNAQNMMKEQHISTQNMMMEIIKTGTHNITHTNSHNKAFNLNFFLNETCKDAMNINDFVNSIQLQLSDLERVGELGYVDGISNIIIKNLKQLDVTKRPVHCTDKKREVLYVKDENKWEKEDTENKTIRKAIKKVSHKNILMLSHFKDAHPDCLKSESKYSDRYNKIVIESFGGQGEDDSKKEDKIIKNLTKTIVIERETDSL